MIREHNLYDFDAFKFFKVCFVTRGIVYLGVCHVHLKIICIMLLLSGGYCKCQLDPVG